MKNKIFFIFAICLFSFLSSGYNPNQNKPKDGVLIHLSSSYDNPHKVLMALSLALKMSENKNVLVFMDIQGVKIAVKNAEDIRIENFDSLNNLLNKLIENKVELMVCPMCLKQAGFKPEDLKEGFKLADKERFFDFTEGRILTLNYWYKKQASSLLLYFEYQ